MKQKLKDEIDAYLKEAVPKMVEEEYIKQQIKELEKEIAIKELEMSMDNLKLNLSYLLRPASIPSTTHFGPILPWIPFRF